MSEVIDSRHPDPARRYDYWLGGKDNFAADRASGDRILAAWPSIRAAALHNRWFMARTAAFLAQAGKHQFLDIGSGLPTRPHATEVVQAIHPAARVVSVDNSPFVAAHGRALTVSDPAGRSEVILADLRSPDSFLAHDLLHETLDLAQPVAVSIGAVLHFIDDTELAYAAVRAVMDRMPAGSYLVASHATADLLPDTVVESLTNAAAGPAAVTGRTRQQFAQIFTDLDLVEPGITIVSTWRPDITFQGHPGLILPATDQEVSIYAAVARKP